MINVQDVLRGVHLLENSCCSVEKPHGLVERLRANSSTSCANDLCVLGDPIDTWLELSSGGMPPEVLIGTHR